MAIHNLKRYAEEQVLVMSRDFGMTAGDIIQLYTGKRPAYATIGDAMLTVERFNHETLH